MERTSSTRRLGGSEVRRVGPGEYTYSWGLTTWRIISQQAASGGETSERAWHVYRDREYGCPAYLNTFATKREAIEMLNVLAYREDCACNRATEAKLAVLRAKMNKEA